MGEDLGQLLGGRYQILDPIGQGGMGAVYRAHDTDLDRLVAVKVLRLPEEVGTDERRIWQARMDREARAAARLNHPGIVTIRERVIGIDGRPWIIMELLSGGSLDDLLRTQGRLPVPQVAAIGRQMLAALTVAHDHGIVHRDIKPANVLFDGDRVVITDFGIAALDGDATLTRTGTILGTPAYMSPEQVRGHPVQPHSDLWSLGATLYAAVEGHPPFAGPIHGAIFVAIATEDPTPPGHAGHLTEVLTGLLRKNPADRPTPARVRDLLAPLADMTLPSPQSSQGPAPTLVGPPTLSADPAPPVSRGILEALAEIVHEITGVSPADVTLDQNIDDLGIDSLSMVEIVVAAEETFELQIPDEAVEDLRTVRDVVEYIERSAGSGAATPSSRTHAPRKWRSALKRFLT